MSELIGWINKNISPKCCRFMAVLPFPSQLSPREWRDLADILEGNPVPEERRLALRKKLNSGERVAEATEGAK